MTTRRKLIGYVTSNQMQKTVVVEVSRTFQHRFYKKTVHSRKRLMAHDELDCQVGDQVCIIESQPLSRRKRWVVTEILRHTIAVGEEKLEV